MYFKWYKNFATVLHTQENWKKPLTLWNHSLNYRIKQGMGEKEAGGTKERNQEENNTTQKN